LDESKKADKPTLDRSQVVFIARMRARIALALSQSYSARMKAKELKRSLSLPYPKNPTDLVPTLDKTHEDEKTRVWPVGGT
jgi:hypothetical protein